MVPPTISILLDQSSTKIQRLQLVVWGWIRTTSYAGVNRFRFHGYDLRTFRKTKRTPQHQWRL